MGIELRRAGDRSWSPSWPGGCNSYAAEACDRLVALGAGPELRIVLNFRRLDYINSGGLTSILICARQLKARGGALAIAEAHGTAAMALATAGFDSLLSMLATEQEAVAALLAG